MRRLIAFSLSQSLIAGILLSNVALANTILCQGKQGQNKNKIVSKIPPKRCSGNFKTIATIPDVYGDASAGDVTITSASQLRALTNFQFANFSIAANSGDVQFHTGTVVRATGTCTINEDVEVESGAGSGSITPIPRVATRGASAQLASPGHSERGAANGEVVLLSITPTETAKGGNGGKGLNDDSLRNLLQPGPIAGGGGGSGGEDFATPSFGGSAAGTLILHCRQGIVIGNSGAIDADGGGGGASGGGGGAGGFVLLTSRSAIVNNGTIDVSGGRGGSSGFDSNSNANYGPGGGGSGGVVHFIASSVTPGNIDVSGGTSPGAGSSLTPTTKHIGGAGGGAFGGDGGSGGDILSSGVPTVSGEGDNGEVFVTEGTPESLFQ